MSFAKKELRTTAFKLSFTPIKMKRTTSFCKQKNCLKKERYLNLINFDNRNAISKISKISKIILRLKRPSGIIFRKIRKFA